MQSVKSFCRPMRLKPIKTTKTCIRLCIKSANSKMYKSYSEIPGPRGVFGIGSFYNYFRIFGKYNWDELHISGMKKYEEYGPIVKERLYPGVDILHLYKPEDIAVLLNDTRCIGYPQRRSHLALKKYRDERPRTYRSAGLLPTNGIEWWRLRSELQKGLSSPKHVRGYLPVVDIVTKSFLEKINANCIIDMLPELSRLNLELICLLAFDERMMSFSEEERKQTSKTSRLLEATYNSNRCILPTDQGFLWRFLETPTYKILRKSQEYIEELAMEFVMKKLNNLNGNVSKLSNSSKGSLLEDYLHNNNLQLSDIIGMVADLLLAGVETTTFSTCFVLYNLAKNKEVQEKLYVECASVLAKPNDLLTPDILNLRIPYTRAVLKESLRLNPISIGVGRILNKDMVLSEYLVPKGTVAVTQNMVACRLESNFESALKFLPERWLEQNRKINPYLVLPFGHGMRACIARRLAEQNMLVFVLRTIQMYSLKWKGDEELGVKTYLINSPDRGIHIKLDRRA